MFEKFVKQPRIPVLTVVSLVLTVTVAVLLLALATDRYSLIALPGTVLVLATGVVLNVVAGIAASSREERRGLEVAVSGTLLWLVIVAVLAYQGRYW
jgi:hypothetical protein